MRARIHTALQFGGGKDSLACLHLLRDRWDDLVVVWLNTGASFPETQAQMAEIANMVPHFLEVRSNVLGDIAENGWPVDVVPTSLTPVGRSCTGDTNALPLRSWLDCCRANFWQPLHDAMRQRGITRIIRGQRDDEAYKNAFLTDGAVIDGITYEFPLQGWTESDVFAFLERVGVAPPAYYAEVQSSLDCWCCTAYLDAKAPQIDYLRRRHPREFAVVKTVLHEALEATERRLDNLRSVVEQTL